MDRADYRQQQEIEEERYDHLIQILGRVAMGSSTVDDALELGRELGLRRPLRLVPPTRETQASFDNLTGKPAWKPMLDNLGIDGKFTR